MLDVGMVSPQQPWESLLSPFCRRRHRTLLGSNVLGQFASLRDSPSESLDGWLTGGFWVVCYLFVCFLPRLSDTKCLLWGERD